MMRKRMNRIIAAGAFLVLASAYWALWVSPALSHRDRLEKTLALKAKDMERMKELQAEWQAFTATREQAKEQLSRRGGDFSLLSFMEGITRKVGVGERIAYMKPVSFSGEREGPHTPVGIEIQLDGLRMQNLVRLLHEIEYSGKLLRVRRIKIKANDEAEKRTLKVTLQVQTYTLGT